MADKIEQRLKELGVTLPAPGSPAGNYIPFVKSGSLVFISGQLPRIDGKVARTGKLGRDVSTDEGKAEARVCAINLITNLKVACGGDLDRVVRCVRLSGFVNSDPAFTDHPQVVNGASDLMVEVFGDNGRHARTAVGVAALPANAAVEVEGIFEIS